MDYKIFFAIYSSKTTSKVGVSDPGKTKETDIVESEFIRIHPGHSSSKGDVTAQELSKTLGQMIVQNVGIFHVGKSTLKLFVSKTSQNVL